MKNLLSEKRIRFKYIAFKASTGTFSYIIQMYIREPNATWDELKNELALRDTDGQHAFMFLRRVKQDENEK